MILILSYEKEDPWFQWQKKNTTNNRVLYEEFMILKLVETGTYITFLFKYLGLGQKFYNKEKKDKSFMIYNVISWWYYLHCKAWSFCCFFFFVYISISFINFHGSHYYSWKVLLLVIVSMKKSTTGHFLYYWH